MMVLLLFTCLCLMLVIMYQVYHFLKISMSFRYLTQIYIGCSFFAAIFMMIRFSFRFYLIENDILSYFILYVCSYCFLIYVLLFMTYWLYRWYHRHHPQALARHWFLYTLVLAVVLGSYGLWNGGQVLKKEYTVNITGLKQDMDMMLVSDLHLSTSVKKNQIKELFAYALQEQVDGILIAGDLFDESTTEKDLKDFCERKAQSSIPVYYALGNHELLTANQKEYLEMLKQYDIILLEDESIVIDNQLQLVGRKDKMVQRKELSKLVSDEYPALVMEHRPIYDDQMVELQVSGHTHNGQIFPNNLFTSIVYPHIYGSYEDPYRMIVSSGYGTWGFPMRIASHNEYVILHLQSSED